MRAFSGTEVAMKPNPVIICAVMLMLGSAAHAATTGRAEAGLVMSRGNSDTDTANARIDVVNERGLWRNNFGLAGLYGRSAEATIATRWSTRWQTDRKFSRGIYSFIGFGYDDDRFSGFDYQATLTSGVGQELIKNERTLFKAQIGAGYRRLRPELLTLDDNGIVISRIKGDTEADMVGNAAVEFERALTDSTKVLAKVTAETGSSNALSRGDLALQVKMTQMLAISVGLNAINNSNPPPGLKKTDTLTTLNLVYQRK
jgi:putative salt-induced outer membrane protein